MRRKAAGRTNCNLINMRRGAVVHITDLPVPPRHANIAESKSALESVLEDGIT